METEAVKRCAGCGEVKALSAFTALRGGMLDRRWECRECQAAARRRARKQRTAYQREWGSANRSQRNAYMRAYREQGGEELAEKQRLYRARWKARRRGLTPPPLPSA